MTRGEGEGRLAERVIAITGAGRGIGRSYALAMAREGAHVIVNDLGTDLEGRGASAAPAEEVAAEIEAAGGSSIANLADVSTVAGAESIVADARAHFGRLDALVNNAAVEFRGSLEEHSAADFDRVLGVNVRGTFNCVRAAIPLLRERDTAAIVNTTSGASWEGTEGVAAYGASKAAVLALTLTQHNELSRHGIRSNCLSPGATRTRMLDAWLIQASAEQGKEESDIAREFGIQTTENLAPLVVYLCSDESRDVSGRAFEVAGDQIIAVSPPRRGAFVRRESASWTFEEIARSIPELAS